MTYITLSDPRVASKPTIDCSEALVSIVNVNDKILIDTSQENIDILGYSPEFLVRKTVAEKLVRAGKSLPDHLFLLVKETLRPISFQKFIFNRRLSRLIAENPELSETDLIELNSRYIAPPRVAGHPTGGAFDVTLCDTVKQEMDLGCNYDEDEKSSSGRCFSFFESLSKEAAANRRVLFECLIGQGFINYPFEWWHWSYGDIYWAAMSNSPHAIYGAVESGGQNGYCKNIY
jgi:D-alanyl-D-alanine dipeptidase